MFILLKYKIKYGKIKIISNKYNYFIFLQVMKIFRYYSLFYNQFFYNKYQRKCHR